MNNEYFFDQVLGVIDRGELAAGTAMIVGKLHSAFADKQVWQETRSSLMQHRLHQVLLEDPFARRSASRPRGYPGDAGLIDFIYDLDHGGEPVSTIGDALFQLSIRFQAPEGVRQRRLAAEQMLRDAWVAGKTVCALACGHLREADGLIGEDLSNITAVDQDQLSLDVVRANHGSRITLHEANVFRFLRSAAARKAKYDLIYTLGLTDYLDERSMRMLHRLIKACLAPGGTIMLANFLPGHLAVGWMDAVMDWQLIYRDEQELERYAREIGMTPHCWRDESGCIVFCSMEGRS